jgi:hypothetical protein
MIVDARRLLLCALALGAAPLAGAGFEGGDPVPPSMLEGRTLHVREANVSIDAPSTAWHWSKSTFPSPLEGKSKVPADMYVCQNSMNESEQPFFFVVARGEIGALTPAVVDGFVQGLKKGSSGGSLIFARPETAPSGIPFPGSYRFRYELVSAHGNGIMFGYLGSTQKALLMTQCVTFSGYEPSAFARFSQSIRVKEEPAPAPDAPAAPVSAFRPGPALGVLGGLLVAIIIFAALRQRSHYSPRSGPPGRPLPRR